MIEQGSRVVAACDLGTEGFFSSGVRKGAKGRVTHVHGGYITDEKFDVLWDDGQASVRLKGSAIESDQVDYL